MIRPASTLPAPAHPTRRRLRVAAAVAFCVGAALPAAAQDAGTTTPTTGDVGIDFATGAQQAIGIDACASRVTSTLSLELTEDYNTLSAATPEYRFYWHTTSEPDCLIGDGSGACPSANASNTCGCIGSGGASSLSFRLDGLGIDPLCDGGPDAIYFSGEIYYPEVDGSAEEVYETSDPVQVDFDRTRPGRSSAAPTLVSLESALKVRGGAIEGADHYEVCARPYTGRLAEPALDGSNDELRVPFTDAECKSADTLSNDGYRYSGLENNIAYEVAFAAVDEAGNRGPTSASAVGTPVPQLDFAELYTNSLGDQAGEQGGCSTRPGLPTPALPALLVLGLVLIARRRLHDRDHGDHE